MVELVITENKPLKKTICLNMIVKNESKIIRETLEKLSSKIKFDYWVICDTGSTDNTIEVIKTFFKEKRIPGEMFQHEWKDFGHNRTMALVCAYKKTDYVLIFDADDEICGDFKLPDTLEHDEYMFQFGNMIDHNIYGRILMVNNHKRWVYVGVLHEVIVPHEHQPTRYIISGNYYTVSGRCGDRNTNNPDKYLKDAKILEKAYHECIEKNDTLYNRYAFYCANSYKDYGDFENAIIWYKKTLTHDNWNQEKYHCCVQLYNCYQQLNQPENSFYYCVKSYNYDNERGEGLFQIIQHYCCENMNEVAYAYYSLIKDYMENRYLTCEFTGDKLFIDNTILQFLLPYYMIIVSEKTRNYSTGIMMYRIIFTKKIRGMQEFFIKCMLFNLQFFVDHIHENDRTDFFKLFAEYITFLQECGYPVSSYDFMANYQKFNIKVNIENTNNKTFSLEQCKESKKILFFAGWSGEKWNYTSSLTRALGGSETAVAYLSKNFPKDYEIYVSGDVEEETIDNVKYIHLFNLPNFFKENPVHTIIISRYIGFLELYSQYLSFYKLYVWAHDTCFHAYGSNFLGEPEIINKWHSRINNVVCLTQWHKILFSDKYPVLKDKIVTINNGIINEMFKYPLDKKVRKRFIYTSCAERGLGRLLHLWPQILEKYPDAQLKISSYNNFPKNQEEEKMLDYIKQTPSIEHLGRLGRDDLYQLMSTGEYWLYPSYWPETSCITALEMLRSEVVCLYFPVAGLVNTMEDYGIPIKEGQELDVLFSITEQQKDVLRFSGRQYAENSTWAERAKVWCSMIFSE
jgi:hypothetical protein